MLILAILGVLMVIFLQPLGFISLLVMGVLLGSFYMGYLYMSFWYSYLLVLVVVSGILVVFVYMVSLIPNENFEVVGICFILFFILGGLVIGFYLEIGNVAAFVGLSLWEDMIFFVNMFVVSFLLVVMMVVVGISMIGLGPVRVVYYVAWSVKG